MENLVINEICLFIIDKCEVMNNGNLEILSKMIVDDVKRIQSKLSQHDVISRFNSTVEKQQSFYSELKALLVKYDAELTIEDFGRNWQIDEKIVVDFKYDESFFEKENTGIVPQLVIGRYENGL